MSCLHTSVQLYCTSCLHILFFNCRFIIWKFILLVGDPLW